MKEYTVYYLNGEYIAIPKEAYEWHSAIDPDCENCKAAKENGQSVWIDSNYIQDLDLEQDQLKALHGCMEDS